MHLIIDADPIVYRAGFAAESVDYHLVMEDANGEVQEYYFYPADGVTAGRRMQDFVRSRPDWVVLEKERIVHVEPESHALEATRTQLASIEKECREHYEITQFESIVPLLSGPGNYREKIATVVPYKGNRDPEHKPVHYQAIRNYLTGEWGAVVIHGREADDECSIRAAAYRQSRIPYIIATIDKDLDQIPGQHYNYHKQVFYAQSEHDAFSWFLQQCLSGDATDGVPGCFRIGATRAAKLVGQWLAESGDTMVRSANAGNAADIRANEPNDGADARPAAIRNGQLAGPIHSVSEQTKRDLWQRIVAEYRASQARPGCPYVESDPEAIALEQARLVYMQQKEGELWEPTGPPHDLLPDYVDEN